MHQDYKITQSQRQLIILSSIYLILQYVIQGFCFHSDFLTRLYSSEFNILNILSILAYGYLLLTFVSYFKHYKLTKLVTLTWIIIITDLIVKQILHATNLFFDIFPETLFSLINLFILVIEIYWAVLILRLNKVNYAAMDTFRHIIFSIIASTILSLIVTAAVVTADLGPNNNIGYILLAIPFFYTIDLTRKLDIKTFDQT